MTRHRVDIAVGALSARALVQCAEEAVIARNTEPIGHRRMADDTRGRITVVERAGIAVVDEGESARRRRAAEPRIVIGIVTANAVAAGIVRAGVAVVTARVRHVQCKCAVRTT